MNEQFVKRVASDYNSLFLSLGWQFITAEKLPSASQPWCTFSHGYSQPIPSANTTPHCTKTFNHRTLQKDVRRKDDPVTSDWILLWNEESRVLFCRNDLDRGGVVWKEGLANVVNGIRGNQSQGEATRNNIQTSHSSVGPLHQKRLAG
ncbi:hypothetical protein AVEN_72188-1 [Araneus ventricosus]|uniref:Uncharacterized protein n=1 Tax=Araneus ventricosus TaxID=182803 RepID=A0A4Y2EIL5_ARAVE|nr:hypothetical protein AVEN_72188-1 [Araneus ventricosus]